MSPEFSIHEITLAVNDIAEASTTLAAAFNGTIDEIQEFPQGNFQLQMGSVWIGDFHIAMVFDPSGEGPVGKFLAKRGPGIYEVNVRTDDLARANAHLKSLGIELFNEQPLVLPDYDAGHGTVLSELLITFVNPKSTHGAMFEVAEWME
jgi:methylmalonyl-CoA/ethylmalonyl-CoA epimerase